ncbi:aldo/keto reductase [Azospirillum soli]|uniref:aldo/keto reductase n=1 Tax=Azospirillum soli TaxID=1304799 RepID=UPI001AE4A4FA|nr:aldo/keto reductase [Azospirillum soli]MBP2316236.1 aryl-alcohol dehydrogenase-like predicted oxidoreductase [Azospirillum soli]
MRYRRLGRTGLEVSEIGFGGWSIGGQTPGATSYGATDDAVSLEALNAALESGITFFDTAPVYGYGRSERLIGEALRHRRDRTVVATKAGMHRYDEPADFSPEAIRQSLAGSLERLGGGCVDLLLLHNPPPELLASGGRLAQCLKDLVSEGIVRAVGASARSPQDALAMLDVDVVDVLEVNLNMLDMWAVDLGLLKAAMEADVGIVARTPLCAGFLSGMLENVSAFAADDHRSRWPAEQVERWKEGAKRALNAAGAAPGPEAVQAALRFCLSWPEVATVIPGIATPAESRQNAMASDLGALSADSLEAVIAAYRNFEAFVPGPQPVAFR